MVFNKLITKTEKKQQAIDAREAFNLWDILNSKYITVERLKIHNNDAHDKELRLILQYFIKTLEENINILEKELMKYSIMAPDQNRRYVNFPSNSQAVTDQFIAGELLIYLQEHIENMMRSFRTSITNDKIRILIKKFILKTVQQADKLILYVKLKGWIANPPLYKNLPANVDEKISVIEISNLWDHLTLRYDNLHTTQVIFTFANDGDFKVTLELGKQLLEKQIKILEKELEYFGIPLPKKPAKVTVKPETTEILNDEHMFRTILTGMQGAAIMHGQPIKECTYNDRIRRLFEDFAMQELTLLDNYFKFGKIKGWLNPAPKYGP